jgi:transposase-like protein
VGPDRSRSSGRWASDSQSPSTVKQPNEGAKFGQTYANGLRCCRPRPGDKWYLDEVFIKIQGKTRYLWRTVDQDGNVLDVLVTSRCDTKAATRFFRKLLKGLEYVPRALVTDKLASYGVAHRRLMPGVEHRRSKYLNNRAENSHQPTRQRERAMKKFSSPGSRKKTTWWFGWFRGVVRRCHGAEEGGLEPHGKLATDLARNAHTTPTNTNPEKSTLFFYDSRVARNGFCPHSAGYHRTSGPVVTRSTPRSTAARWPTASVSGTKSPG